MMCRHAADIDTMIVDLPEARNRLPSLVEAARNGEAVMIANRGTPLVRLVPIDVPDEGTGRVDRFLAWLDASPLPAGMRNDPDRIDASIAAERDAWKRRG